MWEAAGSGSGRWCEPPGLRVRTVCSSLFGWELLVVVIGSYSLHLLICIEAHYLLRSVAYNNERKKKQSSYITKFINKTQNTKDISRLNNGSVNGSCAPRCPSAEAFAVTSTRSRSSRHKGIPAIEITQAGSRLVLVERLLEYELLFQRPEASAGEVVAAGPS